MVLQFLLEILILLSLPIKSNCTSTHGNDSISEKSFPNTIESNQSSSYNQFDADRSSDKPFIKRTNLEFSREREQKNFSTGFHSCQAKFHRPPQQSFKASGQEDGDQRCSYTSSVDKNYNNYSKETARKAYFIRCMKEKCLFDILDAQVKQHGNKDEIMVFANLAKRCLSQNGKERPTMKEIVKELEGIQLLKKKKVSFRLAVLRRFSRGRSMKS
ncbi:hypothetical protein Pint_34481 [Pistacia integerrima]|uniref:Uncharacterized protein n=1 Tax=Pistacia integerrima TaxID=434235 RepID=A0ACC0X4U0_9ROSI|nr:hypothetical protein Pint_34481 [Pistacia integerrima]